MDNRKHCEDILKKDKNLNKIFDKVQKLTTLNVHLIKALPEALKNHCWIADLAEGILTLGTDNSIWITQLRALSMDLLSTLRKCEAGACIQHIKIKVQFLEHLQADKTGQAIEADISPANAEGLKSLADDVKDSRLKSVLMRLASR